ncbi:MAG TPA: FtsX-like permease family protein [Gemmatimonadaceae bacterium]|nr:FtsX-like permease family protein [Gemmatimonadaceae bacterium]
MRIALALAALRRHRARTLLAVLGVAVAAAMLLDMVMLSTGLRESFRQLLLSRGFQLRLAPRGTLPFDTEATIPGASEIVRLLRALPGVAAVSPVLGAQLHVPRDSGAVTAFALGIDPAAQGDYELVAGRDAIAPDAMVANDDFLRAAGARVGDTLLVAAGYDPQLRTFTGERRLVVAGRARFLYLSAGQPAVALPLRTLQRMTARLRGTGEGGDDVVSLFMVRLRQGSDVEGTRRWIQAHVPRVDAISTAGAMARVDQRLSYFRQLGLILGAVSLIVGFLLVTTLVTVSVNERMGEIAVMRAIGISRAHVVQQILLESAAISLGGALLGLGLGLATARYLNGILSAFPGLPAAIDFFLFQPRAAWTALALLAASGVAAGAYPAWRAAGLPVARTLREEAVA